MFPIKIITIQNYEGLKLLEAANLRQQQLYRVCVKP